MSKLMSNFLVFQLKLEQTIIDPGIDVSNKLRKIEKMESLLPSSGNTKMGACGCHGCFFSRNYFPLEAWQKWWFLVILVILLAHPTLRVSHMPGMPCEVTQLVESPISKTWVIRGSSCEFSVFIVQNPKFLGFFAHSISGLVHSVGINLGN